VTCRSLVSAVDDPRVKKSTDRTTSDSPSPRPSPGGRGRSSGVTCTCTPSLSGVQYQLLLAVVLEISVQCWIPRSKRQAAASFPACSSAWMP
jgi:hypothetical protein